MVEISSSDDDLAGKGPSAPKREVQIKNVYLSLHYMHIVHYIFV